MKPKHKSGLAIVAILVVLYHYAAFTAWQWRNPKANQMTVWSHYIDAITWKKLPEFQ